jgi:O-antigen/teichoic acid export membrane protein
LQGRYRRSAMALVISGAGGALVSIGLALSWRQDAWALLFGSLTGLLASILVLGVPSIRELARPSGLGDLDRTQIIRLGLPGLVTATMYWIISASDRWILNYITGPEVLGTYTFASSIALLGLMVNSAVTVVWFPEATRLYERDASSAPTVLGRFWAKIVVLLALVWLVVASSGGDILRILADPRFHSGASYIPWIAAGVFFYGVASLANTGMIIGKDMRPAAWSWLFGTSTSVGLNLMFVPRWGAVAAACVGCVGYLVIACSCMYASEKRFSIAVPWAQLYAVLFGIAVVGLVMAPPWNEAPLVSLMYKLPVGIAVAITSAILIAPGKAYSLRLRLAQALSYQ